MIHDPATPPPPSPSDEPPPAAPLTASGPPPPDAGGGASPRDQLRKLFLEYMLERKEGGHPRDRVILFNFLWSMIDDAASSGGLASRQYDYSFAGAFQGPDQWGDASPLYGLPYEEAIGAFGPGFTGYGPPPGAGGYGGPPGAGGYGAAPDFTGHGPPAGAHGYGDPSGYAGYPGHFGFPGQGGYAGPFPASPVYAPPADGDPSAALAPPGPDAQIGDGAAERRREGRGRHSRGGRHLRGHWGNRTE
jgi:hypothetical protein